MRIVLAVVMSAALTACADTRDLPAPPAAPKEIPKAPLRGWTVPASYRDSFQGDWDQIVARGYLRIAHISNETEPDRAEMRTYDAAVALEQWLNERIAPRKITIGLRGVLERQVAIEVVEGRADIGANVRLTFARDDQVAFAAPIRTGVRELVVVGPSEPALVSLEDVGNRAIYVREGSDHKESVERLNGQLKKIDRAPARLVETQHATDEMLLRRVNAGGLNATVVDDYIFESLRSELPRVQVNRDVSVSQDGVITWVTRRDAPKLLALINEFFSTHKLTF